MIVSSLIFAKLDPGFFGNRKIIRAGRNGRDVFLAALCMNAARGARGVIPAADMEPWYLAHYLGISEDDARDGVTRAVAAELIAIEGSAVTIIGWDEDWSRRALTRAEIQKGYRERKKNGQSERYRDSVTRDDRSNALPIRGEERRGERDTSNASPDSLSRDSSPDRRPSARSAAPEQPQPLPSAWEPSVSASALAQSLGVDLAHEATQFRLNAAARGHRFVDPDAAFEKFMRQSHDRGKHKPPKPGAVSAKPRRARQVIDGRVFVEDDDGNPVPLDEKGTT